jgi:DNA polymerase III subunit beta
MKFHVKTTDFQKAISAVEGVVTVREIKSALSNIKVEVEDSKVFLSATDLEISIKTSVQCKTFKTGTGSIPAKKLSNIIKTINFQDTSIETTKDSEDGDRTLITDSEGKVDFKMTINGIDSEDIQTIPKINPEDTFEIPCATFSEMIKKTSYSVAQEDTRFVFNGLYVVTDKHKIIIVGTDGRRLTKVEREINNHLPFEKGVIIPHKAINEILRIIDSNDSGSVALINNQIYVKVKDVELLCKLIDGNYPDYEAVIPKDTSNQVKIPKDQFAIALRQALIAAEEPSKQVRLEFSENMVTLSSATPGATEAKISLSIDYNGDEVMIAFKGDYLTDIVKSIHDPEMTIEFKSSTSPVIFKDPSDPQYIAVVMPMKL